MPMRREEESIPEGLTLRGRGPKARKPEAGPHVPEAREATERERERERENGRASERERCCLGAWGRQNSSSGALQWPPMGARGV